MLSELNLEQGIWAGLFPLYQNPSFTDYTIIIGLERQRFSTHKALLYARSGFFKRLFENLQNLAPDENPNEIFLKDFKPKIFERLFPFFYTGRMEITGMECIELYKMWHWLEIKDLRNEIAKYISSSLSPDLVAPALQLANKYKVRKLKKVCLEYVNENADLLLQTDAFLSWLAKSDFQTILESDQLDCREVQIYFAVIRWGEIWLKPGEVLQEKIDDLLSYIRLGRLTKTEIDSVIKPSGFFSPQKLEIFTKMGVAGIDRPRIEGSMQFGLINDTTQGRLVNNGHGVLKTGSNEGVVALGKYKLQKRWSVLLRIEKGGGSGNGYIAIGVANPNVVQMVPCVINENTQGDFVALLSQYNRSRLVGSGTAQFYGVPMKTGDTIELNIDMRNQELRYWNKEVDLGAVSIAHLPEPLHLAVWLYYPNDGVSIITN